MESRRSTARQGVPNAFVAEIGKINRFESTAGPLFMGGRTHTRPPKCRRKGPPGTHHQDGSRLVRWAAIEAVARWPSRSGLPGADPQAIAARRGRTKANVAIARKVLTLVD